MTTATRTKKKPVRAVKDRTESPLDAELPRQSESLPGQQELPGLPADLPTVRIVNKRTELVPRPSLVPFLEELDIPAFLDNWTIKEMQAKVKARYGTHKATRVTGKEFREAKTQAFRWWKACRLFPEVEAITATELQWDRLTRAATFYLEQMQGRTLKQCVRLVRTKAPCNSHLLRGLPSRFHVWK